MAVSSSYRENGGDEVREDEEFCSYCSADGKLQPALHFCFDCGMCGKYMCGFCLKDHNRFLRNHETVKLDHSLTSKRRNDEFKALQQSYEELEKETKNLQYDNGKLTSDIFQVRKENEQLVKELHDRKVALDLVNCTFNAKIEEFERDSKKNEIRLMTMVNERDNLISRRNDEFQALQQSNEKLAKENQNLQNDKTELTSGIFDVRVEKDRLVKELHDCKVAIDLSNDTFKTKIGEFERDSKENEIRLMTIVNEKDDIISRRNDELTALQQSNKDLQKDNKNIEKDITDLINDIFDVRKENDRLVKELHDSKVALGLANDTLKTKIDEFERDSKKEQIRVMAIVNERDHFISRAKEYDSNQKAVQQSNLKLQKDKNKLQEENADLLVNMENIDKERERLSKELHESKEALHLANSKFQTKMEEFECEMSKEKNVLILRSKENDAKFKSLKISKGNLQRDINSPETENAQLLASINELKKDNEQLSKDLHVMTKKAFGPMFKVKDNSDPSVTTRDGHCSANVEKRPIILVTAIDIGHTSTSCAFSFRDEYDYDPLYCKVLCDETVVLFDANKKFHSFGRKAEEKYSKLSYDGDCHKWYFFRRFMATLRSEKLDLSRTIVDQSGKEMAAVDVLSAIIEHCKEYLFNGTDLLRDDDVIWVVPVAALWTDTVKQIMREAVCKAGIDDENLTLVSEPEAASVYCHMLPVVKLRGSTKVIKQTSQYISSPGTKFMVIDLGGNTADFTIFERQTDGGLTEVKAATGEACCNTRFEKGFLGIIRKVLGNDIFQKCLNEDPEEFLEVQRNLNWKSIYNELVDERNKYISSHWPVSFASALREISQQAIPRSQFDGKIICLGDKLRIDVELIKDLLKSCVDIIVKYIQYLLDEPDVEDTGVFLMVGGFSNLLMVQDAIMKAFPNVNVIVPEQPENAVAKGALIFGHGL